jgi:hypothetical protein
MKKDYIAPELEIVYVETHRMMTGSPTTGGDYKPGDPVLAPGLDDDFELEPLP